MTTGFVERIKGKLKAHILFVGAGGIKDANSGAMIAGGTPLDSLTAHAGGGRASAVALQYGWNRIATVATGADSVVLPAAVVNASVVVINDGANAAQIFGAGTDTVDGVAGSTGVAITNAKRDIFFCLTAGAWQSLLGGKSA